MDDQLGAILQRAFPACRVEACSELKGGVSARAVMVKLLLHDATAKRVVVRRPSCPILEETLSVVRREYAILSRGSALGLPVPRPCFLDVTAGALVLEYVEGAPDFEPPNLNDALAQMATQLVSIHAVPLDAELESLPRRSESAASMILRTPEQLDMTLDEPRLRAALGHLWPWEQHNPNVLLHGDYWPGNLLWRSGKLSAVLDWEEVEVGDPLADLAVSRLDVLWAFGEAAMHTFTELYRQRTQLDWRNLARWDLCVALRPMSRLATWAKAYAEPPIARPDIDVLSMRGGHRRFVEQALRALNVDSY